MSNHSNLFSVVPQSDYMRMPWKNGLGETLEIAVSQENDEVLYRVSQAAVVEDGAFSDFSGLQRTLVLLKGNGMFLSHKNAQKEYQHNLEQVLSVAHFAGGDSTYATLSNGAIEDLNIMVREGKAGSDVQAIFSPASFDVSRDSHSLFTGFYANSDCELLVQSQTIQQSIAIPNQATVLLHQNSQITLQKGCGVFIVITANTIS
ncbi:HutD family protein [Vibrio diazotrophicus]|uniref:HutD/Ves family protein n=1 Tax=Vibrio diazotrophicus TaxID=685 RepID=UPI00069388A1|nr:HutD family protein [Vibrio diazotrophicus]MCZ4370217.1 HutD family protein [Vibrio diazotrophicus]